MHAHEDTVILPIPFPRFFAPTLNSRGFAEKKNTGEFVNSAPTASTLLLQAHTGLKLDSLAKELKSMKVAEKMQLHKNGFKEEDEIAELVHALQETASAYLELKEVKSDEEDMEEAQLSDEQ